MWFIRLEWPVLKQLPDCARHPLSGTSLFLLLSSSLCLSLPLPLLLSLLCPFRPCYFLCISRWFRMQEELIVCNSISLYLLSLSLRSSVSERAKVIQKSKSHLCQQLGRGQSWQIENANGTTSVWQLSTGGGSSGRSSRKEQKEQRKTNFVAGKNKQSSARSHAAVVARCVCVISGSTYPPSVPSVLMTIKVAEMTQTKCIVAKIGSVRAATTTTTSTSH